MEKMTIEKAREIPLKHMSDQNQECRCRTCGHCDGFVEGWESREGEIEELKKKIDAYETQLMSTYRKETK